MTFETLNESIEVIVHFYVKTFQQLRFKWKERAYKVKKLIKNGPKEWDKLS